MSKSTHIQQLKMEAANGNVASLMELKEIAEENGGDAEALFLLGLLFDESSATKISTDSMLARQYYLRASLLGHGQAQLSIGNMLDYGDGGDKDLVEAKRWYAAAANQGVRDAQMHFGRMLETGRGGLADEEEAAKWYLLAAAQGDELAATNLAMMHLRGVLQKSDLDLAVKLFHFSADKLDGVAHIHLGDIYMGGHHVEQHNGKALVHYCIASLLLPGGANQEAAVSRRDDLMSQIPDNAKRQFEELAVKYIAERNGKIPS